jgi:hypothetical protein
MIVDAFESGCTIGTVIEHLPDLVLGIIVLMVRYDGLKREEGIVKELAQLLLVIKLADANL